ncbi:MAG: 50S ribosomal protein L15 [Acidobacteriota bacterium]|nr:MAG: 50S ribosomal protein L15 [Acidobacteriota bacterium]
MRLHDIGPAPGAKKRRKRVGRGPGSGLGKTAGRGHNGQKSRSGYSRRWGFEGGQMPLVRRLPKRGFTNLFRHEHATVNVHQLERFETGTEVTPHLLASSGLLRSTETSSVKLLGRGELTTALTVRVHAVSASARQKVEAAGGKVEIIGAGADAS